MGYDFSLSVVSNKCNHCDRSDYNELKKLYMSYNHGWAWRKFVDKDVGFRIIYDMPLKEVKAMCEKVIDGVKELNGGKTPEHLKNADGNDVWANSNVYSKRIQIIDNEGEPQLQWANDDGWARTYYNAYRCASEIMKVTSVSMMSDNTAEARWSGD